jgi:hypothetical protein
MFFPFFIIGRLLFVACMVFVIGYVFGNFSKSRRLTRLTRVASILAIVLFISTNIFLLRTGGRYHHNHYGNYGWRHYQQDSIIDRH